MAEPIPNQPCPDLGKSLHMLGYAPTNISLSSKVDLPFITSVFWRAVHLDLQDVLMTCICHICDLSLLTSEEIDFTKLLSPITSFSRIDSFLTINYELRVTIYRFLKKELTSKQCLQKLANLNMRLNTYLRKETNYQNFITLLKVYFTFFEGNILQLKNDTYKETFLYEVFPNCIEMFYKQQIHKERQKLNDLKVPKEFEMYWNRLKEVLLENKLEVQLKALSNFYKSISIKNLANILEINEKNIRKQLIEWKTISFDESKRFVIFKFERKSNLQELTESISMATTEFGNMAVEAKRRRKRDSKKEKEDKNEYTEEYLDLDDIDKLDDYLSDSEESC